jgi:hypothetical protein
VKNVLSGANSSLFLLLPLHTYTHIHYFSRSVDGANDDANLEQ